MSKNNSDSVLDMIGEVLPLFGKLLLWITIATLRLLAYLLKASEELLRTILR